MKKVGIIFAMQEEIDAIKKLVNIEKENKVYELTFYEATINNNKCIMVQSGMGKVNAARTAQLLIDNYKVDYMFNVGVAGGVDESLKIGDIVIGDKLVQHDYDAVGLNFEKGFIHNVGKYLEADDYLSNLAYKQILPAEGNSIKNGIIATGDLFCTDPKKGAEINKEYGALCVEMEGASIGQVCKLCEVPFLTIRGISDVPNNNNKISFDEFLEKDLGTISNGMKNILENIE